MENKNLTTPEAAKKIMGDSMISLEEAMTVFPQTKEILNSAYDLIPFGQELLYYCSDEARPFVLFPAFPRCGNLSLTIFKMFNLFENGGGRFFNPWSKDIELHKPEFLTHTVCEPRWYLVSKNVMTIGEMKKFRDAHEYRNPDSFGPERSVVYIHAWLLFKILRKISILDNDLIGCLDTFHHRSGSLAYLTFKAGRIGIGQWKPRGNPDNEPGFVPSVESYTE